MVEPSSWHTLPAFIDIHSMSSGALEPITLKNLLVEWVLSLPTTSHADQRKQLNISIPFQLLVEYIANGLPSYF